MNQVCIVIPYFGKFPEYFPLFLKTCAYNPSFTWLIYTDDKRPFDYPDNVKVKYCTFDDVQKKIESKFPFKIELTKPYKLCDYKIAYGDIFADDLRGYEFWGFCDVDLLFGNLGQFITEDVLRHNDRILARGHLTLLRNTDEINKIYKSRSKSLFVDYQYAFTTKYCCHFDEFEPWLSVFEENHLRQWIMPIMADINPDKYLFHLVGNTKDQDRQVFCWHKGRLKRLYISDGIIQKDEWAYIHFQKRNMLVMCNAHSDNDTVVIVPNELLVDDNIEINKSFIKRHSSEDLSHHLYLSRRVNRLKEIFNNVKNGALSYRRKRYLSDIKGDK